MRQKIMLGTCRKENPLTLNCNYQFSELCFHSVIHLLKLLQDFSNSHVPSFENCNVQGQLKTFASLPIVWGFLMCLMTQYNSIPVEYLYYYHKEFIDLFQYMCFTLHFSSLYSLTFSPSGRKGRKSKAKSKPLHSDTA